MVDFGLGIVNQRILGSESGLDTFGLWNGRTYGVLYGILFGSRV